MLLNLSVNMMKGFFPTFTTGFLLVILSIGGIWVSPAAAHRVNIFAWVDGDTVHTESKFSGGKKVVGGQVVVTDLQGNRLVEGQTDENGAFSFKMVQRTPMRIELVAGMGHRGEWMVRAEEVGYTPGRMSEEDNRQSDHRSNANVNSPTSTTALGPEEIERIVDAALDRKLEPVKRMIAETKPTGPSISDVIGGIGYILGLVGLAAYVNYRRKSKDRSK